MNKLLELVVHPFCIVDVVQVAAKFRNCSLWTIVVLERVTNYDVRDGTVSRIWTISLFVLYRKPVIRNYRSFPTSSSCENCNLLANKVQEISSILIFQLFFCNQLGRNHWLSFKFLILYGHLETYPNTEWWPNNDSLVNLCTFYSISATKITFSPG